MKAGKFFTGKNLAQDDLEGKEVKVTICDAKVETVGNDEEGREQKIVVYFEQFEKGLVLNATNYNTIFDHCNGSDETDNWLGKIGTLYVDPNVMFGKKKTGGLRIKFDNKRNGLVSSTEIMAILELVGDLGWKPSELKKVLRNKFNVEKLEELKSEKINQLVEILNSGTENK